MNILQKTRERGFTIVEIMVVVAIIAVLGTVVVLTLNPAELLAQGRDTKRISALSTLNIAIGTVQAPGISMGSSSVVYVSVPDSSPTCNDLGLPALPSGWSYGCAPSSTYLAADGTGWIPIAFNKSSFNSVISTLPVDPVNATSSGLYYTYVTNGTQWMLTAFPESKKQKASLQSNPELPGYPGVMAQGSDLALSPIFDWNSRSMIGYWPLNEGSGTTALDTSGNNYNGTWSGTQAGLNSTYYGAGSVEPWAGYFNGSNDYVDMGTSVNPSGSAGMTIAAWIDPSSYTATNGYLINKGADYPTYNAYGLAVTSGVTMHSVFFWTYGSNTYKSSGVANVAPTGSWTFVVVTVSGDTQGSPAAIYINGSLVLSFTIGNAIPPSTLDFRIGQQDRSVYDYPYTGYVNDVRAYNTVLSAAEIQALYNSQK